MGMFDNPFVRFCTSGLGTGTTAGKAVGLTILIIGFAFIAAFYVCKWAYNFFKKRKMSKAAAAGAAMVALAMLQACSSGNAATDNAGQDEKVEAVEPAELDIKGLEELAKKDGANLTEDDYDFLLDQFEIIANEMKSLSEEDAKSYMDKMDSERVGAVILVSMAVQNASKKGILTSAQQRRFESLVPEDKK